MFAHTYTDIITWIKNSWCYLGRAGSFSVLGAVARVKAETFMEKLVNISTAGTVNMWVGVRKLYLSFLPTLLAIFMTFLASIFNDNKTRIAWVNFNAFCACLVQDKVWFAFDAESFLTLAFVATFLTFLAVFVWIKECSFWALFALDTLSIVYKKHLAFWSLTAQTEWLINTLACSTWALAT